MFRIVKVSDAVGEMYSIDEDVKGKIEKILDSEECKNLLKKADDLGSAIKALNDWYPHKKRKDLKEIISKSWPFKSKEHYISKENYLMFLKEEYELLMAPFEEDFPLILKIMYPGIAKKWEKDLNTSKELLKNFFVEYNLISELDDKVWEKIKNSEDEEVAIAHEIYKIKFSESFKKFLDKIPWMVSKDRYIAPPLDIVSWLPPGMRLPKKPFGIEKKFIENIVKMIERGQIYGEIVNDEKKKVKRIEDIMQEIQEEGVAILDIYVGINKIEGDYILHQRMIIWENPGWKKYKKAGFTEKMMIKKPTEYLCIIYEEVISLELRYI